MCTAMRLMRHIGVPYFATVGFGRPLGDKLLRDDLGPRSPTCLPLLYPD